MTLWIEDDAVKEALKSGSDDSLVDSGVPFCISEDRRYCVLVREHSAWVVPGEGWREANNPPERGGQGRFVLNLYKDQVGNKAGFWFKTFIPTREGRVQVVRESETRCMIRGDATELHLPFHRIDGLMWDLMSGNAQQEEEIERLYSLVGQE